MSLDLKEILKFAQYSNLAYGKSPLPNDKYEWIDGLKNPKPVDIQCLVIYEQNRTIFSFRGTDDFKKWMIDAEVAFKPLGNKIKVHSGFYNSVDSIYPQLLKIAKKQMVPIVTTGHSKGAAESRQFSYRLAKQNGIITTTSITFGEPRSFNRTGADDYNKLNIPTFRMIDEEDGVCRIPWLLGLYKHVYDEYFLDAWGNILKNEPWYAHIPSDLTGMIKELIRRKNAPIDDHSILIYIDRIKELI